MSASSAPDAPDAGRVLLERIARELAGPAPDAARRVSDAVRERHGDAVRAVLFYGSCLRRQSAEGVLDLYVLVDRYRDVYGVRPAAALGALLPPNVHYLECEPRPGAEVGHGDRLRAKYAVVSLAHFERLCGPRSASPTVWARFAQPARLLFAADAATRERVAAACAEAALTFVRRLAPLAPERSSPAAFWRDSFARTYATELRGEPPERVAEIYAADPARYDAVLAVARDVLAREGVLAPVEPGASAPAYSRARRRRARLGWICARPLARALHLARLVKTPVTFDGWVAYALWKVERHTGVRIEPSERQLRHPWIFGWPVLLRLLARRELR